VVAVPGPVEDLLEEPMQQPPKGREIRRFAQLAVDHFGPKFGSRCRGQETRASQKNACIRGGDPNNAAAER
jgi:hypothetical protein